MQAGKPQLYYVRLEYLPPDIRRCRIYGRSRSLLCGQLYIAAVRPSAPILQTVETG